MRDRRLRVRRGCCGRVQPRLPLFGVLLDPSHSLAAEQTSHQRAQRRVIADQCCLRYLMR